jgi:hypothetical protein
MKRIQMWVGMFLLVAGLAHAQFKYPTSSPKISEQISNPTQIGSSFLNGILDMNRLRMSQSYSMTYMSTGGKGTTLGMYMNTLSYQISDKIDTKLHLGFSHSPFGGNNAYSNPSQFIGGAELNYRLSNNTIFQFQISQLPGYYNGWYSRGYIPMESPSSNPTDGK